MGPIKWYHKENCILLQHTLELVFVFSQSKSLWKHKFFLLLKMAFFVLCPSEEEQEYFTWKYAKTGFAALGGRERAPNAS